MATGTTLPPKQPEGSQPPPARYASFIEQRLEFTRRQVKTVDVASGIMILAAGTLLFFLAVAVLDQWIVTGGLGALSRWLLWLGWLATAGVFFWRKVLPALANRINPVYAAQTIEQTRPTLKNSLINFLLVRSHRDEVQPVVYHALEQRAAADLSQTHIEHAVDRQGVIRLAYLLAACVVVFAIYVAVSPKSPLVSAARVLWPWAGIAAPTRVTFNDIRPGDTVAFQDERQEVSAEVTGLRGGENVTLVMSTADGQIVDQSITMTRDGDGNRFQCSLPPGAGGLKQDLVYHLTAGDCTSAPFKIEVQVAPNIEVDRLEYHFPAYTGLPPRTVEGTGDIKALEGTVVTLHATATQEIRDAKIDLNCAGLRSLPMKSAGNAATGQLTLAFDAGDPTHQSYDSYQILFSDAQGRGNRRPARSAVTIIRDLPPEVSFVLPKDDESSVAQDGRLEIRVRAFDPDFALRKVILHAERGGQALSIPLLLDREPPMKPWQGPFEKSYAFEPRKLGLRAGDQVKYWAEALDNKEPKANSTETSPRLIHILSAEMAAQQPGAENRPHRAEPNRQNPAQQSDPQDKADGQPRANPDAGDKPNGEPEKPQKSDSTPSGKSQRDEQASPDRKSDGANEPKPGDAQKESGSAGDKADPSSAEQGGANPNQDQQNNNSANQPGQKTDPTSQAPDAMNDILKDRQEKHPEEKEPQPNDQNQEKSAEQNKSGEQKPNAAGDQPQDQPKKDGQQPGDPQKSDAQPQSGDQQNSTGQPQPGEQKKPGDQQQSGAEKSPNQGAQNSGGASGSQPDQKQKGDQGGAPQQSPGGGQKPDKNQQGSPSGTENQPPSGGQQGDPKQKGGQNSPDNQMAAGGPPKPDQKSPSGGQDSKQSQGGMSKPEQKNQPGGKNSGGAEGGGDKNKPEQKQDSGGASGGQSKPGQKESSQQSPGGGTPQKGRGGSKGGDEDNSGRQQDPGKGKGNDAKNADGTPSPDAQEPSEGQPKTGDSQQRPGLDPAKSPAVNPKPSKSSGDAPGERKGGGGSGGGQGDKQTGKGSSGSNSAAESGGAASKEKGPGETGAKPGDAVKSPDKKTDSATKAMGEGGQQNEKPATPSERATAKKPATDAEPSANQQNEKSTNGAAGQTPAGQPGTPGAGMPLSGGGGNQTGDAAPPLPAENRGPDDPNLDFTRKQVDLALDHLKDQLGKDKPKVLEKLGWSKEEGEKFLRDWQSRMAAAQQSGPQGAAAKKSLDEALKSLGLRPRGTQLRGGRTTKDQMGRLHDAGQLDPPGDWADYSRAYSRATAGGR